MSLLLLPSLWQYVDGAKSARAYQYKALADECCVAVGLAVGWPLVVALFVVLALVLVVVFTWETTAKERVASILLVGRCWVDAPRRRRLAIATGFATTKPRRILATAKRWPTVRAIWLAND